MNQVIVVPVQHEKECMLVEGKRFCREEELSRQEAGTLCLVVAAVCAYIVVLCWLMNRAPEWVVVSAFIGPWLVAGLCLMAF